MHNPALALGFHTAGGDVESGELHSRSGIVIVLDA